MTAGECWHCGGLHDTSECAGRNGRSSDDLAIVHVIRPSLPWRAATLTECGLLVAGQATGRPVITREDFLAKVKRQGQNRSRLTTCQTCWDTARRWPTWEDDPVKAIGREVERWGSPTHTARIRGELLAIAALIERHRPEFDELLEDVAAVVRLEPGKGGRAQ